MMIEDQLEWDFVSGPLMMLQVEQGSGTSLSPSPSLLLMSPLSEHTMLLQKWLTEEGYAIQIAATTRAALALLEQRSFQCVLIDLFSGPFDSFIRALEPLRKRGWSLQVGVITSEELSAEEAEEYGFAFTLSKPVQIERLFTELALGLRLPLTAEQKRQAQVIKDFFAAARAKNKQKMLELCTNTIAYYPSASHRWLSLFSASCSKGAEVLYADFIGQRSSALRLEFEGIYSRPRGLAVQYSAWWAKHQGWEVQTDTLLFHFLADRIRQIGLALSIEG